MGPLVQGQDLGMLGDGKKEGGPSTKRGSPGQGGPSGQDLDMMEMVRRKGALRAKEALQAKTWTCWEMVRRKGALRAKGALWAKTWTC